MRPTRIFLICGLLIAVASGLFAYKVIALHFPVQPNQTARSWVVEAQLRFTPQRDTPLRVSMFTPQGTDHLAKVNDNLAANGYGIERRIGRETRNQRVILTRRTAKGRQIVFYRAAFYALTSSDRPAATDDPQRPVQPAASPFTITTDAPTQTQRAAQELIATAQSRSADTGSFMLELAKILQDMRGGIGANVLQDETMSGRPATLPELTVGLANAAGVPARLVNGIVLRERQHGLPLLQWVEFYEAGRWRSLDAVNARLGIGTDYLPWWRGAQPLFTVEGGTRAEIVMTARINREAALTQALWRTQTRGTLAATLIRNASLLDLPVETQLMFNIVLMIPVGALVIVMLRQLVGIQTFGTFMPVLMALAFRETGLVWGVALFALIVLIGLRLRAYFDGLRLLAVPRLAAILTIVVLLIAVLTVILFRLGFNTGLSITLFPMIILTMTIERMALLAEEFGNAAARRTAYGTILAAGIAYGVMHNDGMDHLLFLFPELLLIVLAACILLGRYNGYKLSEYLRFRQLARRMHDDAAGP